MFRDTRFGGVEVVGVGSAEMLIELAEPDQAAAEFLGDISGGAGPRVWSEGRREEAA